MEVIRSNRSETLVDELARVVSQRPLSPFEPEVIVVPSQGMQRWLSLELSKRLDVWANPQFPFPRAVIEQLLTAFIDDDEARGQRFEPATLRWTIATALDHFESDPSFQEVNAYLDAGDRSARRLHLSRQLADLFDRTIVYRPDVIGAWDKGRSDDWQATLWRHLVKELGPHHLAARVKELEVVIQAGAREPKQLPTRIQFFSVQTLPPLFVEALCQVASRIETRLFVLSPTQEFWEDIRPKKRIRRAAAKAQLSFEDTLQEFALFEGHPLLASNGSVGREFDKTLSEYAEHISTSQAIFVEPGDASMLHRLQTEMLHLQAPGERDPSAQADDSISIHACTGRLREVQVLHDHLRSYLEQDDSLAPNDIVVMAPDIGDYAPLVEAVFSSGDVPIPFHVTDRVPASEDAVISDVLTLLEALEGRLSANTVLDLLSLRSLKRTVQLDAEDRAALKELIREAGIRWGADAEHCEELGQPGDGFHSWRAGLDRLLLGLALPSEGLHLFNGVLGCGQEQTEAGALLERVVPFCEQLFEFRRRFQESHSLEEWAEQIIMLLSAFVSDDESAAEPTQQLRTTAGRLADEAALAGFDQRVSLRTFREELERALDRTARPSNFLSRGVVFCKMLPMRSIPFRVVCLLGMNADQFPRTDALPDIAQFATRRVGDRTTRDDDRHLFLEALLSARQRLFISFVTSPRSKEPEETLSPAVQELIDAMPEPIVPIVHPLRPYDEKYFSSDSVTLFSHSAHYLEVANSRRGDAPSGAAIESLTDAMPEAVSIRELTEWLLNPCRAFARSRLGVALGSESGPLEDSTPVFAGSLDTWVVGQRALDGLSQGQSPDRVEAFVQATPLFPPGALGTVARNDVRTELERLLGSLPPTLGPAMAPLMLHTECGGVAIEGTVRDIHEEQLLRVRYSKEPKRDELRLWVEHLLINVAAPSTYPKRSVLVGRSRVTELGSVPEARSILENLVALYRRAWDSPAPLFPIASRTYATQIREGKSPDAALLAARKAFFGDWGGDADAYVARLMGVDPVIEHKNEFAELSLELYGPFLDHARVDVSP